jgi:hypothetical protein
MIKFFMSPDHFNDWLKDNQQWEPISVSQGHMSGSVLVLFKQAWVSEQANSPIEPAKRGPGRPPKAKDA